jgi:hypothetical protein
MSIPMRSSPTYARHFLRYYAISTISYYRIPAVFAIFSVYSQ